MAKQDLHFVKTGLNSDDELRIMQAGDSRFRLNCRCDDNNRGAFGAVENVMGNEQIYFPLPKGDNKMCGYCEDKENRAIFFCIWNSGGEHQIYRFYTDTNVVELICMNVLLGFTHDYYISSINVVDDKLYWVDGAGEPHKINITRMYNYTNAIAVNPLFTYSSVDESMFVAIRQGSPQAPLAVYNSDVSKPYNNLRGKIFQFAYRWVYDQWERSANSPVSKVPLPQNEAQFTGQWVDDTTLNNVIDITTLSGSENVRSIELMVREGNIGKWFVFDTIDKYNVAGDELYTSNGYIYYSLSSGLGFYNDVVRTATVDDEVQRPFDYIPNKALAQEVIFDPASGARLVYGGITEGYDNIDVDADATQINKYIDLSSYNNTFFSDPLLPAGSPHRLSSQIDFTTHTIVNKFYQFAFSLDSDIVETISFTNPFTNPSDLATFLKDKIMASTTLNFILASIPIGSPNICSWQVWDDKINKVATVNITGGVTAEFPTLKQGSYYDIGIVYYDKYNRNGGVQKINRTYIPTLHEILSPQMPTLTGYHQFGLQTQINHLPPDWAVNYQIVRSKSSIHSSRFYHINKIQTHAASGNLLLMVNKTLTETTDQLVKYQVPLYKGDKGDKVRLIGYTKTITAPNACSIQDTVEKSIIGQDAGGTGEPIIEPDGTWLGIQADLLGGVIDWCTVEIYTPNLNLSEDIYYEYGETRPIVLDAFGARVHSGNIITQSTDGHGNPFITAVNEDYAADSFVRKSIAIETGAATVLPSIQGSISDFYDSEVYDIGRANAYIKQMRTEKLGANIRYSDKYLDNTQINGLSTFYYDHYVKVADEYGDINRLIETGFTLKVLQPSKVTSIYIGRTSSFNPDGTQTILLTDSILGTIRPYEEQVGCTHPESACKMDRYIYFWDGNRGDVYRDSANGLAAVGDLKMSNHFSDLANNFKMSGTPYWALGALDLKHNEYILTFKEKTDNGYIYNPINSTGIANTYQCFTSAETVMFHEPSNRWKTYYAFVPEGYGWFSNTLISFVNATLWKHNVNPLNNNFYGYQSYSALDMYSQTQAPDKVKVFKNMSIHSNKKWAAPTTGDIFIPANDMIPGGMSSRLNATKFIYKEGVFYSEFLRDVLTPNPPADVILNGRPLRGHVIGVRLSNYDTENVVLFSVSVEAIASEKS